MKTPQELLHQALEVGECLLPDAPPGAMLAGTINACVPIL